MKTAYLYVRVSTDEQKRKGYSLPEQEDRLLKYCQYNGLTVKGIYREDFSAKSFNRPEWKKLLAIVKGKSIKETNNILFVKWDRFSRNIANAYEMLGILRKYNTTAMAIDQPIDFQIPESSVMLAVYLAVPEAENARRSLNTSNGMRRAKLLGRHPNRAPIGYQNVTAPDGKKYIIPQKFEAEIIRWSFEQLSKNAYSMEEVRRMANAKGLRCARSHFWKLLHNPVYCGFITVSSNEPQGLQLIKGIHDPLISENLFNEVQSIINSKRKFTSKIKESNDVLILRKYLICPACKRNLTASFSKGRRNKKYPYYHCRNSCKTRFKAEIINKNYEDQLRKFRLSSEAVQLFNLILEDVNLSTTREIYLKERKLLQKQIGDQEFYISKARKFFVVGNIEYQDFYNMKKEYQVVSDDLKDELGKNKVKLNFIEKLYKRVDKLHKNIFANFGDFEVNDQKTIIAQLPPSKLDINGNLSLKIGGGLSKILIAKN